MKTGLSGFKGSMPSLLLLSILLPSLAQGWGTDGHLIVCRIAQGRLREEPREVLEELLPDYAHDDLSSVCSWPDHVRFLYPWSSPLHYVDTPDHLCTYDYNRDCRDVETGKQGMCVSGAIRNYTDQLLRHRGAPLAHGPYNLTQALLFLSHFMGDIHQPLHVGFTSDKGGNTIEVEWYTRRETLHHVWDSDVIEMAKQRFYNKSVDSLIDDINRNITGIWADQVPGWESCSSNAAACSDMYDDSLRYHHIPSHKGATESIHAACDLAYKNVTNGTALGDEYFHASLSVVYRRLAQGGVRQGEISPWSLKNSGVHLVLPLGVKPWYAMYDYTLVYNRGEANDMRQVLLNKGTSPVVAKLSTDAERFSIRRRGLGFGP